uniref:hypothetical protein n=1 Tax=Chryseobacterium mulctrae TaxID=2576777 RepID=UPI0013902C79
MVLTKIQEIEIKTIALNFFEGLGEIQTITVNQSDIFFNINIFPKSSLVFGFHDIETFTEKLEDNNFPLRHSANLIVIDFNLLNHCIILSLNFLEV